MSPLVPTSSRDTIPCRSLAPLVAMRYPAAARPPTTVGPVQPTLGWAATPTGLSTTTRSSSSWMIVMPGTGSATTAACAEAAGSGNETSSQAPANTRSDLPTGRWSRVTAPVAARSAALVRDTPKSRARAASTRSPSSPSGTGRARRSGIVAGSRLVPRTMVLGARPVDADPPDREQADQHRRGDDGRVGDVEDRPVRKLDEVHHVAPARAGRADHPVREVADGAAEEQTQGPRPAAAAESTARHDDHHDDRGGDEGEDPRGAGGDREGGTGVAGEVEAPQRPDDVLGTVGVEVRKGPGLGQLVGGVDDQRRNDEDHEQPGTTGRAAGRGLLRGRRAD